VVRDHYNDQDPKREKKKNLLLTERKEKGEPNAAALPCTRSMQIFCKRGGQDTKKRTGERVYR